MSYYQKHIFFCTNQRQSGKRCCGEGGEAERLRQYAKHRLKALGLHGAHRVRVNACGCLDRCEEGPMLVIYPEGIWCSYRTYKDIDDILERYILNPERNNEK